MGAQPTAAPRRAGDLHLDSRSHRSGDVVRVGRGATPARAGRGGDFDVEGQGEVAFAPRQPKLILENLPPTYRVEGGAVVAESALSLRIDTDGGDGAFREALLRQIPQVTAASEDAPTEGPWTVKARGEGSFEVTGHKAWAGAEQDIFASTEEALVLEIDWPPGGMSQRLPITVENPAKWGVVAYGLIGLAALALLLGLYAWAQFRAPPLTGKLLYTHPSLAGTVGRLDLSGLGRGAAAIRSDTKGRLSLGGRKSGKDGQAIAMVRASRIGGLLLVPREKGKPERRLLVDGLSLQSGDHQLRYFSGQGDEDTVLVPTVEAPDLIGSEFDLESGRTLGIEVPETEPIEVQRKSASKDEGDAAS